MFNNKRCHRSLWITPLLSTWLAQNGLFLKTHSFSHTYLLKLKCKRGKFCSKRRYFTSQQSQENIFWVYNSSLSFNRVEREKGKPVLVTLIQNSWNIKFIMPDKKAISLSGRAYIVRLALIKTCLAVEIWTRSVSTAAFFLNFN